MGNALRLFFKCSSDPLPDSPPPSAVAALAHDLFNFQNTSQVPRGLDKHVQSSVRDQAQWYKKILVKWRKAKPPPETAEEAARLVIEALNGVRIADVEGFLYFYGLILADVPVEYPPETSVTLPEGVKYEFQTLPVDPKAVQDGDSMTVYVSVTSDQREADNVPKEVISNAERRLKASISKRYDMANSFHEKIIEAGYRILKIGNEEILARKCRIRLRGIDAPEHKMPYADEAKVELTNLVKGKRLRILFYELDQYGRSVGDIYCNGVFVQEVMLKKGCAWHYVTYDKRPELARWEKEARARRMGLWGLPNPEMPWKWRKNNPRSN